MARMAHAPLVARRSSSALPAKHNASTSASGPFNKLTSRRRDTTLDQHARPAAAAAGGASSSAASSPPWACLMPHGRGGSGSSNSRPAGNQYDDEIGHVALPALCAMLLEPCVGVINSALVGHRGTTQLGAVSVGSLAVSFATFLFSFLMFLTTPEVAAALSNGDRDKASKITCKALWVAGIFGVLSTLAVGLGAEAIVGYLQPPDPAVATGAIGFIRIRAFGMMPALLGYVVIGVYRGHKDTRTPLYAAVLLAICSLSLNALFLYGLNMGAAGCALAMTLASMMSCTMLCAGMVVKDMLRVPDLFTPPSWAAVAPMLRAGMPLSLRNAIAFGIVLFASLLCVRIGTAYQAAFEVVRQVWVLTIQSFECLNVSTQVLCAAYLGAGDVARARGVMERLVVLGVAIGALAGLALFFSRELVARFFTKDPAVITQVLWTLPMVAMMLPLDAAASIMDGSLMIAGAGVQYVALLYLAANNLINTLTVWSCLKLLTVFRLLGGVVRNFASSKTAYPHASEWRPPATAAATVAATAAARASVEDGVPGRASAAQGEGGPEQQFTALDSMDADCGVEPSLMSLIDWEYVSGSSGSVAEDGAGAGGALGSKGAGSGPGSSGMQQQQEEGEARDLEEAGEEAWMSPAVESGEQWQRDMGSSSVGGWGGEADAGGSSSSYAVTFLRATEAELCMREAGLEEDDRPELQLSMGGGGSGSQGSSSSSRSGSSSTSAESNVVTVQ